MFLLPACQQSCQVSIILQKTYTQRKKKFNQNNTRSTLQSFSETPSQVLSTTCQQQPTRTKQIPLFTLPLDAKHSRREETQRIHGIFKAKGERKKKWYEYDIDEDLLGTYKVFFNLTNKKKKKRTSIMLRNMIINNY